MGDADAHEDGTTEKEQAPTTLTLIQSRTAADSVSMTATLVNGHEEERCCTVCGEPFP